MSVINVAALQAARKSLLEAEEQLEQGGLGETSFQVGLIADDVADHISEALDDGSLQW